MIGRPRACKEYIGKGGHVTQSRSMWVPRILATPSDVLSPRMVHLIENLAGDWRRLDERIESLSSEIEAIARQDAGCERLMSVPGIGPIISSAMVAAIGSGEVFT